MPSFRLWIAKLTLSIALLLQIEEIIGIYSCGKRTSVDAKNHQDIQERAVSERNSCLNDENTMNLKRTF